MDSEKEQEELAKLIGRFTPMSLGMCEHLAKTLFFFGYRKESDVAKRVLDEVVEACFVRGDDEYIEIYRDEWEALEKKYGNENWCGKESEGKK